MHTIILPKILATLEKVKDAGKLATVYDAPSPELKGYPAAVFYPIRYDGSMLTNQENTVGFRYRIVVVTETKQAGMRKAYNEVLAGAVDAIIQQFATDWSQGDVDGHRLWWDLTGGDWGLSSEAEGTLAWATLELNVNTIINI